MNLIDMIKRDAEAGTPGPWMEWIGEIGTEGKCVVDVGSINTGQSDINRIARVPSMEAALIAADELANLVADCLENENLDNFSAQADALAAYHAKTGGDT